MECAVCHRREASKTRCVNGHYVCNDCHTQGMDSIFGLCLSEGSADPVSILRRMMDLPFCHMHGPEHHVMVGAGPAHRLQERRRRARPGEGAPRDVQPGQGRPGGTCGFWGACGAGIGAGQFMAIATESTPLAREPWGLSNRMTARAWTASAGQGGPGAVSGTPGWRPWPLWTSRGSIWGWRWSGPSLSAPTAAGTASVSAGAAPSQRQGVKDPKWPSSASTTPAAARWRRLWAENWPAMCSRAVPPAPRPASGSIPGPCG